MTKTIHFMRGTQRFDIVRDSDLAWVGYLNGKPTIAAAQPYLVARALLQMPIQRTQPDRGVSTTIG